MSGRVNAFSHTISPLPAQLLRDAKFGYRAKFICDTAAYLISISKCASPEQDLLELRGKSYDEARAYLMKCPGVGAKVADCICLMGLGMPHVIPVDVHVRQIAARWFGVGGTSKSLTPSHYKAVQVAFETRYGEYAGWAHSVSFSAAMNPLTFAFRFYLHLI